MKHLKYCISDIFFDLDYPMLSKDMIQTKDSSPKHFITGIAITNCQTVHPLPHTDSGAIH